MKKFWVIILCIVSIMLLTSCKTENGNSNGGKSTPKNSDTVGDQEAIDYLNKEDDEIVSIESSDNQATEKTAPNDFTGFKDGLTNFIAAYTTIKEPYAALIDESPESENYLFDLLGYYMLDLNLVTVPLYDVFNPASNGPRVTGNLMLSGYEGFKEKDGDLIRFGYEHVFSEEKGMNEIGDVTKQSGCFDTKKNYLTIEDTTERDGKLIQRSFYEMTSPTEGTFILQNYSYDERTASRNTNCTFLKFNSDTLYYLESTKDPTTDFTYKALEPNQEISLDDLSSDSTVIFKISIENSIPVFESTKGD